MNNIFSNIVEYIIESPTIFVSDKNKPYMIVDTKNNSIKTVEKISSINNIDNYTIYFTNGNSFDYYITNGV